MLARLPCGACIHAFSATVQEPLRGARTTQVQRQQAVTGCLPIKGTFHQLRNPSTPLSSLSPPPLGTNP